MKYLRALWRAGATLGMAVPLALAQAFLIGPLAALKGEVAGPRQEDFTYIPQKMQRNLCKIFNVELDVRGTQLDHDLQAMIVANHLSWLDAPVLGSLFRGAFVGKADIARWPGVGYLAKCFRTIFIERTKAYLPQAHKKLVDAFNEGQTLIVFPEGTTTNGADVKMFRAGLLKVLFNEAVDTTGRPLVVKSDVIVQPVALRVMETNGQDATNNQSARDIYCWYEGDGCKTVLHHIWKALMADGMKVQVHILPALQPKDFPNRFDLINTAQKMVREIVLDRPLPAPEPWTPEMQQPA